MHSIIITVMLHPHPHTPTDQDQINGPAAQCSLYFNTDITRETANFSLAKAIAIHCWLICMCILRIWCIWQGADWRDCTFISVPMQGSNCVVCSKFCLKLSHVQSNIVQRPELSNFQDKHQHSSSQEGSVGQSVSPLLWFRHKYLGYCCHCLQWCTWPWL